MKPNKSRIRLWIKALRSGKFKRTAGRLRGNGNRRCCLGVACDVFAKATGRGRWAAEVAGAGFAVGYDYSSSAMPGAVRCWFGLTDSNPDIYEAVSGCMMPPTAMTR